MRLGSVSIKASTIIHNTYSQHRASTLSIRPDLQFVVACLLCCVYNGSWPSSPVVCKNDFLVANLVTSSQVCRSQGCHDCDCNNTSVDEMLVVTREESSRRVVFREVERICWSTLLRAFPSVFHLGDPTELSLIELFSCFSKQVLWITLVLFSLATNFDEKTRWAAKELLMKGPFSVSYSTKCLCGA